ncbi:50S ribosomal protein L11 methyltransferase [Myxococcota bacterium]|nr:50S ribosomal protein L11 methyltransferase [Myxococcota bacterium]MCZ7619113.1 50S ribosomal protein L11 methyltransferase [Myxococcota bacterium]
MSARSANPSADRFVRIRARAAAESGEIAGAEAWAAGASGIEECADGTLVIYAPDACGDGVREALVACLGAAAVDASEPVPVADWPELWKQGLRPLVVSERLVVRPPFAASPVRRGQRQLVIEPRQAFGTGAHATTALALAALDAAHASLAGARVLDVGCGSGVLALAALALGARAAVACDLDPIAARETRENAHANRLAKRLVVFTGSVAAVAPVAFDLVVANMIRRELLPLLGELTACVGGAGRLVLSGLLVSEQGLMEAALASAGLRIVATRSEADASGDRWLAFTTTR